MTGITIKHHYVPVFLLKQFIDNDGQFFVFDKEKQQFKKSGGKFSPESHFFTPHDNTLFSEKDSNDLIETEHYRKYDNKMALFINSIPENLNVGIHEIEEGYLEDIYLFSATLPWRTHLPKK